AGKALAFGAHPVTAVALGVMTGGLMLGLTEAWAQVFFGAIGREFAVYALLFLTLTLRSGLAARRKEQHFDRRVVPR
ncbi:MAG: hypothetical protein EBW52_13065, partial [Betaproteobacteria bacterium]|nr:hypothetical protein [Betaproteobacteria bacterium]